jgi:hypothetical protein
MYRLLSEVGELWAKIGGALRHESPDFGILPAGEDWVMILSHRAFLLICPFSPEKDSRISLKKKINK